MSVPLHHAEVVQPEDISNRKHGAFLRESLRDEAKYHVRLTLGDHFKENSKTSPGGEYGYEKRSTKYKKNKQRQFGHSRPLDRTGRMKRHVRANAVVTATQHRSRVRIRNYYQMTPQRRMELENIAESEGPGMTQRIFDGYNARVNDFRKTRIRKRTR